MLKSLLTRIIGNKGGKDDAEKSEVRFSLYLEKAPFQVAIAGSFNHWSCFSHPLRLSSSGLWETTVPLAPGKYRYRFLVDNSVWVLDPLVESIPNEYGGTDSVLLVPQPTDAIPRRDDTIVAQEQYV